MAWFNNLKISRKLLVSFAAVALLAVVVGVVGILNYRAATKSYADVFVNYGSSQGTLGKADVLFQDLRIQLRNILLFEDETTRSKIVDSIKSDKETLLKELANYEKTVLTAEEQAIFKELKTNCELYVAAIDKGVAMALEGKNEEALAYLNGEPAKQGAAANKAFLDDIDYNSTTGNKLSAALAQQANVTIIIMVVIVVVAVAVAIGLGLSISGNISKPINILADFAKILAVGDVDASKVVSEKDKAALAARKDELGTLAQSFDQVIEATLKLADQARLVADGDLTTSVTIRSVDDTVAQSLSELVNKFHEVASAIVGSAEQLASGSNLVSESSVTLSQGATHQASAIEELSASLEEIASQTSLNAQNADKASGFSDRAKEFAVRGNDQMNEMLTAMIDINDASTNINKIIKVIDDIAFQTNILALNAAVEAARAGQHGKGFAVVAEEVRTLAGRSASAAKETTVMIETAIAKISSGTNIANETAEALCQIVEEVEKTAELVRAIAVASKEQESGIEQINQGVTQIAQVVQTNAATSEESAAASEELSSQAAQLREIVSIFKLQNQRQQFKASSPKVASKSQDFASQRRSAPAAEPAARPKISLSDGDFGKY